MKKFLVDRMCQELGKWLRAAGYDEEIIDSSMRDPDIFQKAQKEGRSLITRDKYFKEVDPEGKTVIYLKGEDLRGWASQLRDFGVDWLFKPFTRCLKCNVELVKIPPPEDAPINIKEFWSCPECHEVFWRGSHTERMEEQLSEWNQDPILTLGLGGDLMFGRLVNEALDVVTPHYVWGNLRPIMEKVDLNFVNLETTLTFSNKMVPKVFNFKADPDKVSVLTEAHIEGVNIANNHILDYSNEGLVETIEALDQAKIFHVGAGRESGEAKSPHIIEKNGIIVGFLGCTDNEPSWKASAKKPGINYIEVGDIKSLRESITSLRSRVDLLVLSIHWGPNMKQKPDPEFQSFAHELIDLGVDILHGHSAHIFQGVEVYKGKLILYDTGDLLDDYAIDPFLRNDRSFYFIVTVSKKNIISLKMIPTIISEFQVNICKDNEPLERMKALSKEFKTDLIQEDHTLNIQVQHIS